MCRPSACPVSRTNMGSPGPGCGTRGGYRLQTSPLPPRRRDTARRSPQHRGGPHADVRARRIDDASPIRHKGAVGSEAQGTERGIGDIGFRPLCQVVELPGPHLRHPNVHSSVAVRTKGYEPTVARNGRRLFVAREVGQPLIACISQDARRGVASQLPDGDAGNNEYHGRSQIHGPSRRRGAAGGATTATSFVGPTARQAPAPAGDRRRPDGRSDRGPTHRGRSGMRGLIPACRAGDGGLASLPVSPTFAPWSRLAGDSPRSLSMNPGGRRADAR